MGEEVGGGSRESVLVQARGRGDAGVAVWVPSEAEEGSGSGSRGTVGSLAWALLCSHSPCGKKKAGSQYRAGNPSQELLPGSALGLEVWLDNGTDSDRDETELMDLLKGGPTRGPLALRPGSVSLSLPVFSFTLQPNCLPVRTPASGEGDAKAGSLGCLPLG